MGIVNCRVPDGNSGTSESGKLDLHGPNPPEQGRPKQAHGQAAKADHVQNRPGSATPEASHGHGWRPEDPLTGRRWGLSGDGCCLDHQSPFQKQRPASSAENRGCGLQCEWTPARWAERGRENRTASPDFVLFDWSSPELLGCLRVYMCSSSKTTWFNVPESIWKPLP